MAKVEDLPKSFTDDGPLNNPQANGSWEARYDVEGRSNGQSLSWLGPFAERLDFRDAALYKPETITLGSGTVTRNVPLICPYDEQLSALGVRFRSLTALSDEEADELGLDNETEDPYGRIIATVDFGVLPYGTGGDTPFVSLRMQSSPKRATIPNYAYVLVDDSNVFVEGLAQDVAVPINEETIEVVWHGLTDLAGFNAVVRPLVDTVNSVTVVLPQLNLTCPIGTLYVAGCNGSQTISTGNVSKAEASVQLIRRTLPWNRAIGSGGTPRWVAPSGALSSRPFASADPQPIWRGY